ncbi:hypothetical protein ILUMI_26560 [Ignelater luminosus]|uniref:Mitochondrial inner membrane protein Mpv17 n=1 Tax=Ignelater luminosus TaxID=2038154 RepID=A0A8K0C493_IGNLU|nr:hypothetical protein ILUMI_26560 [Ignelater luminosus]
MGTVLRIYENALRRYPLLTSSIQTSMLMATGDIISQTVIEETSLKKVNLKRTAQFASVGLFLAGPALTTWYRVLAKTFGDKGHTSVVLKKVALDQFVFAPAFIGVFLTALGVVQGKDPQVTVAEVKKNYLDVVISNYKLWPWVQLGNFYLVPLRYQVLVVQLVAILWNTYLSWKTQASDVIKTKDVSTNLVEQ